MASSIQGPSALRSNFQRPRAAPPRTLYKNASPDDVPPVAPLFSVMRANPTPSSPAPRPSTNFLVYRKWINSVTVLRLGACAVWSFCLSLVTFHLLTYVLSWGVSGLIWELFSWRRLWLAFWFAIGQGCAFFARCLEVSATKQLHGYADRIWDVVINSKHWTYIALHVLSVLICSWSVIGSSLAPTSSFFLHPCPASTADVSSAVDVLCTDRSRLFVACAIFFFSFSAALHSLLTNQSTLFFPSFQRSRLMRIKDRIPSLLSKGGRFTLLYVCLLYLFFFFLESPLSRFASYLLSWWIGSYLELVSTGFLLPLSSIVFAFTILFPTYFGWQLGQHLIEIFCTELVHFDVSDLETAFLLPQQAPQVPTNIKLAENDLLIEGLHDTQNPLYQHLAFMYLHHIAQLSSSARQSIFQHAWPQVSSACLNLIQSFLDAVHAESKENGAGASFTIPSPAPGTTTTTSVWSRLPQHPEQLKQVLLQRSPASVQPLVQRLVAILFDLSPSQRTARTFQHLEALTWAIQSLSLLCVHSLEEDRQGSVQHNLESVISALLACSLALEQYVRSTRFLPPTTSVPSDFLGHQISRPQPLQLGFHVDNAVYRIVMAFYPYLDKFTFPTDYARRLQQYADFAK